MAGVGSQTPSGASIKLDTQLMELIMPLTAHQLVSGGNNRQLVSKFTLKCKTNQKKDLATILIIN